MSLPILSMQKIPSHLKKQRNILLQDALRPGFNEYSIEEEYPIILKSDCPEFSFCALSGRRGTNQELLAHANLWPRTLICNESGNTVDIGLIGNVATKESVRGLGIMQKLLDFLWNRARETNLKALILWSDLNEFYSKMGFRQKGEELRMFLYLDDLIKYTPLPDPVQVVSSEILSLKDLKDLLRLRYSTPAHMKRSPGEFKTLLRIPDTLLMIQGSLPVPDGYCILGKGFDMPGVIHEWGATSPEIIRNIIRHILVTTGWEYLMLLSPPFTNNPWSAIFTEGARRIEKHPLGHIRTDEGSPAEKVFQKSFLWGLDTI